MVPNGKRPARRGGNREAQTKVGTEGGERNKYKVEIIKSEWEGGEGTKSPVRGENKAP